MHTLIQKIGNRKFCILLIIFLMLSGCANLHRNSVGNHAHRKVKNYQTQGNASWYGAKFHRKRTASGERFNMYKMTAAHRTLPLASRVLVTNMKNGRQVVVKINDRGPFVKNRIIDLSYAAARKIGMIGHGTVPVKLKVIA